MADDSCYLSHHLTALKTVWYANLIIIHLDINRITCCVPEILHQGRLIFVFVKPMGRRKEMRKLNTMALAIWLWGMTNLDLQEMTRQGPTTLCWELATTTHPMVVWLQGVLMKLAGFMLALAGGGIIPPAATAQASAAGTTIRPMVITQASARDNANLRAGSMIGK